MNVLEVKNLYKDYHKQRALKNINITIRENEIIGFVGPNGAGKSTLMKIMVGLIPSTKGNVTIMGYDVKKNRERALEKIGCTIETPYFYEYLTGRENLQIIANMYKHIAKENLIKVAKKVGIHDSLDKKVKAYSLGMKQRLALAQAIIMNPKILILDEPTNGLDPQGIVEFRNILKDINQSGCTIFISSHILSEIENICQKVIFINNGQIIKEKVMGNESEEYENYVIRCSRINEFHDLLEIEEYVEQCNINKDNIYLTIKKNSIKDVIKLSVTKDIDIYYISEVKKNLEAEFFDVLREEGK
ncbi:ABC transporter ATP-binding protein [Clostridium manihotivorum]|uniref:Bacitracin ABC transporter ATP-binding protein n=1 Tax=Clostridium manihotivorum TaxID=2320868 RepID=A0A3R5TGN3_9CLOT|nr:ATP-binding cassette domain-containing protein [Clostridium manihotivorum]QAA33039.1 bacitracin ABC transporter ATP-binding protein [Clostridium manihotivorum]